MPSREARPRFLARRHQLLELVLAAVQIRRYPEAQG